MYCIDSHTHQLTDNPKIIRIYNVRMGKEDTLPTKGYYSMGVHPWDIKKNDKVNIEINDNKQLIAIGECGLDKYIKVKLSKQVEVFKNHVEISEKIHKPLIIHCVGMFNEIISLNKTLKPAQKWIIHGFSGHPQLAKQLSKQGILLSFGEAITKKDSKAAKSLQILNKDLFFLETDESNASISNIYKQAAIIRNETEEDLMHRLYKQFQRIFNITI